MKLSKGNIAFIYIATSSFVVVLFFSFTFLFENVASFRQVVLAACPTDLCASGTWYGEPYSLNYTKTSTGYDVSGQKGGIPFTETWEGAFVAGTQGSQGPQGPGGSRGPTGYSGNTGSQGSKGQVGNAGSGMYGCNWSGKRWMSHGWDAGCAFSSGLNVYCSGGVITSITQHSGCGFASTP